MQNISATKRVRKTGSSLVIYITDELRMLEVGNGELVKITIEKVVAN